MEAATRKRRWITILVPGVLAVALAVAVVSVHEQHVKRAQLEARLDELSKQMVTLQAEIASAPPPTPLHQLADAAVGDFPESPKVDAKPADSGRRP